MKNSVTLELDIITAAAVRDCLFRDTKIYTYDSVSCPQRITNLRNLIVDIDEKIEKVLTAEAKEISKLESEAPDSGVGK